MIESENNQTAHSAFGVSECAAIVSGASPSGSDLFRHFWSWTICGTEDLLVEQVYPEIILL